MVVEVLFHQYAGHPLALSALLISQRAHHLKGGVVFRVDLCVKHCNNLDPALLSQKEPKVRPIMKSPFLEP